MIHGVGAGEGEGESEIDCADAKAREGREMCGRRADRAAEGRARRGEKAFIIAVVKCPRRNGHTGKGRRPESSSSF